MNFQSKLTKTGYELESINIVQAPYSPIDHRGDCNPMITLCNRRVYPVIVAPMGAVTNENNYKIWLDNNFICVVPRTVDINKRIAISEETFASFSLTEAEEILLNLPRFREEDELEVNPIVRYVCIDIAHGTMVRLYEICEKLKTKFGESMEIMTGNVATPDAYEFYNRSGIDYMRACIGTGSRCTTSCNVGVHYPTASLLDELRIKYEVARDRLVSDSDYPTRFIADGGIANFDDIQKCLCLGATAVMSGSIFAKAREACEPIFYLQPNNLNLADGIPEAEYFEKLDALRTYIRMGDENAQIALEKLEKRRPYRLYYGMSTKMAQCKTGGSGQTTAEGIAKPIPVEYDIQKWADNMKSYLVSCMSYTGCTTIEELRRDSELIVNLSTDKSFRK